MATPEQAPGRSKNAHYAISVRKEAVRLVESGLSQQAVRQQFGVGHMTLLAWLQRYGTRRCAANSSPLPRSSTLPESYSTAV